MGSGKVSTMVKTMEEFAAATGISRPTVSKYFNDPASVRPATRARIEAALKRLNYRPNLFAVNFNRRQPKTFGMIVPSLIDPFYAGLVERIELRALKDGYWTIVLSSHGTRTMEARAVRTLLSLRVAGAIIAPLGMSSQISPLSQLAASLPLVVLDARVDVSAAFVGTDNFRSIGLIVDYLIRTGEPPCYFDMPNMNGNAEERRRGYVQAMERADAEPVVIPSSRESWNFEAEGFEQANRLFGAKALPSRTILCASDRTAFGVMSAANEHNLRVSRENGDIRVAGHDDHPLSKFASPSLTTVGQESEQIANRAVDTLIGRISGSIAPRSHQVHLFEAKLQMRNSA
jgi:LacI family transcriptional regulator, repressor for deo operon, udp, cdd, tsx, nupC, and nupG